MNCEMNVMLFIYKRMFCLASIRAFNQLNSLPLVEYLFFVGDLPSSLTFQQILKTNETYDDDLRAGHQ